MTTHTTQKMRGPHSKSQHRPPHDTPACHPVRTRDSLFLHGLFHLSWLASFSRVFPSIKWGESTMSILQAFYPSLCLKQEGDGSLKAVSSWEEGCLEAGWVQRWGIWDSLLSNGLWKLGYLTAGRCIRCTAHCSVVSLHLTWPNCGQSLAPHDLSGLGMIQVKPAVSLPPIRNAPLPQAEAREFRNFFLDK